VSHRGVSLVVSRGGWDAYRGPLGARLGVVACEHHLHTSHQPPPATTSQHRRQHHHRHRHNNNTCCYQDGGKRGVEDIWGTRVVLRPSSA
jgi:ABC-type nickel/cobalt efflux system permease component RcnA